MSQDRTYKTRLAAAALILSVAAIVLAPVLVMPGVAKAQDAPAIIASDRERAIQKTVEDEKRTAREALDAEKQHREREIREGSQNLWDRLTHDIGVTMANVSASVMITMGQMMASNLAENAATWVATGSWGQQPLIYQTPWQAYMDGIVDQALGSFVYSIGSVFGINSCVAQVPLGFRLRLVNDLRNPFQTHPLPIIGQCRWTDIKKSWSDLADRVDKFGNPFDSERMLAYFQDSLSAGGTDINNQENLIFLSLGKIQRDAFEAQQDRERSDYRAVRDPAGNTRMTATRVEREAELTTANRQAVREDAYFAGLLANGAESIASVFTSTFINSLVFKLLNPEYSEAPQVQPEFTQFSSFINPYGEEIAKAAFSGLKTTRVIEVGQVDLLQEFTTCPDKYVGQNNCVIDSKFEAGIRLAQTGRSLTVAEAIDKGYLHGDWFLIPPTNVAKNADPSCRVEAYCHSNLKKMRKARILTIGWEMAAKISPVDAPDTLQKVVDAFGDCNSAGAADDAHPYCHLINPKWILKLPATQCRAKVFGPTLEAAESGNRKEYCADYRTCINEAPDGTCPSGTGGWGYCVREKNTWRINGDTCPPQFNTCTTFAKRTGEVNSFLLSTVNYSVCNDANKGCKKYLNAPNAAGSYDAVKSVYLNARAQSCPPTDAGCTDLQDVSGASQFLKIPPISLDCKGDDNDPVQCNAYASPCNADEVGCERYTPENDDPPVPGTYTPAERDSNGAILAWNNECDKSCVGYNAFIQNASLFDTATPTEYFVPSSATSCLAAYEGCDSFTNLDKTIGDNTEYYNALRRCEKPSPDIKHGTYYYWEGSDVSGYELKSIELRSVVSSIVPQNVTLTGVAGDALVSSSGSPPVYDTSVSAVLTGYMKACNQYTYTNRDNPLVTFDPDCRELFDGAGKVSYRLLAHTIIVSDQCVKLRKTLSDQATCGATGGVWSAGTGTCSYNALPSLSGACPAEANLCRGYRGNAAQITKSVFYDEFNTLGNWTGGVLSSESLAVGEGSLKLTAATAQTPVTLTPSSLYTLTFWAKGSGVLSVDLTAIPALGAPVLKTFTPTASLGNDWKLYIMGPVDFGSSAAVNGTLKVSATNVKASPVFLDKVNLKASAGKIYIVKNSWKTPAVCDADPNDSLPGLALGCSAYKDRAGKEVDLTGFTSICREKAVGCQQFVNTYNYGDVVSKVFNKGDGEVFVPGDAIEFYVNDPKMKCPAASQGCSKLGVENSSGSVDDAYFIDNPDNYEGSGGILCKASEENCDSWGANNVTYYFKDPLGARCVYDDTIGWVVEGSITPCSPENILSDGKYGIWKNGDTAYTGLTGVCDSEQNGCTEFIDREDKTIDADGKRYYLLDNGKLDKKSCGTGVSLKEGCILFDDTRNLIKKFSSSFSYEDSNAQGGAKVTPVNLTDLKSASTLTVKTVVEGVETEAPVKFCIDILRDLNTYCAEDQAELTSTDPAVVALAEARLAINCDLDITSDAYFLKPELVSSYKPTQDACRAALGPSNLILKVQRDRACSKWLACQSSAPYFDPTTQIQRQACSSVDLCQRLNTAATGGSAADCAEWTTDPLVDSAVLTRDLYSSRDVTWFGEDFSGYSIPDQFPIQNLRFFGAGTEVRLGAVDKTHSADCSKNNTAVADGTGCANVGTATAAIYAGACYQGLCFKAINGQGGFGLDQYVGSACRGFPQSDSPFPSSVARKRSLYGQPMSLAAGFTRANVCEQFDQYPALLNTQAPEQVTQSCNCNYKKLTYGRAGVVRFVDRGAVEVAGVCQGGLDKNKTPKDGQTCVKNADCTNDLKVQGTLSPDDIPDGLCLRKSKVEPFVGWPGYCLEYDQRTYVNGSLDQNACLTWLPVDIAPGAEDLNNQFESAGYHKDQYAGSGQFYCLYGRGNAHNVGDKSLYIWGNTPDTIDFEIGVFTAGSHVGIMKGYKQSLMDSDTNYKNYINGFILKEPFGLGRDIHRDEIDYVEIKFLENPQPGAHTRPEPDSFVRIVNDGTPRLYGNKEMSKMYFNAGPLNKDYTTNDDMFSEGEGGTVVVKDATTDNGGTVLTYTHRVEDPSSPFGIIGLKTPAPDVYTHPGADDSFVMRFDDNISGKGGESAKGIGGILSADKLTNLIRDDFLNRSDSEVFCGMDDDVEKRGSAFQLDFDKNGLLTGWTAGTCNARASGEGPGYCSGQFGAPSGVYDKNDSHKVAGWEYSLNSCGKGIPSPLAQLHIMVSIHLRETCSSVAGVINGLGENAAWTNRLWTPENTSAIDYKKFEEDFFLKSSPNSSLMVGKSFENPPYGSFKNDGLAPSEDGLWHSFSDLTKTAAAQKEKPNSLVGAAALGCGTAGGASAGRCGETSAFSGLRSSNFSDAQNTLTQLFARVYNVYQQTSLQNPEGAQDNYFYTLMTKYEDKPSSVYNKTSANGIGHATNHPVVASFNTSNVGGATPCEKGVKCPLTALNSFLVNGKQESTVYGVKALAATIRFFGWADINQMPIRRVRVDWGDGKPMVDQNGKFKNHKPYCSTESKPARFCVKGDGLHWNVGDTYAVKEPNVTCRTNDDCAVLLGTKFDTTATNSKLGVDIGCQPEKVCQNSLTTNILVACSNNNDCQATAPATGGKNLGACMDNPKLQWVFGNTATETTEACTGEPFSFEHGYSYSDDCGKKGINLTVGSSVRETYGLPNTLFQDGDKICVFKPRVQLLDNWGWCNGVTSATDATAKGWHNDESGDVGATNVNRCESNAQGFIKDINATPFAGYIVVKN